MHSSTSSSSVARFVARLAFVGRGRSLFGYPLPEDRGVEKAPPLGSREDGFVSLDEEQAAVFALRREMFGSLEEDRYQEKLATLRAGVEDEEGDGRVTDLEIELLESAVERVQ